MKFEDVKIGDLYVRESGKMYRIDNEWKRYEFYSLYLRGIKMKYYQFDKSIEVENELDWEKVNRSVGEFKVGDVYLRHDNLFYDSLEFIKYETDITYARLNDFNRDLMKCLYPIESMREVKLVKAHL